VPCRGGPARHWLNAAARKDPTRFIGEKHISGKLVLATDIGAFIASAATPTAWSRFGAGLPNSAIYDFSLGSDASYIIAATHGRGLWKISAPQT
jgi:hypothetical protein